MRDISFLEWFLLGMPIEWFVLMVIIGGAFLIWATAATWLARLRRDRQERREDRSGRGRARGG
jgi:threonine/homoserine/homoserine lactone efflux protein